MRYSIRPSTDSKYMSKLIGSSHESNTPGTCARYHEDTTLKEWLQNLEKNESAVK